MTLTPAAMERLLAHSWPGNIRELKNTVVQAAVLATGSVVDADDLRIRVASRPAGIAVQETNLELMERRMIFDALEKAGGHQQRAADQLGISRRTLSRKLKQYQMETVGAL